MGGFGSGRPGGRSTVEGCRSLVLDINRIMRPGADALRGRELARDAEVRLGPRRLRWTRQGEAEPWAEVEVSLTVHREHAAAALRFAIEPWSDRAGPRAQRVGHRQHAMPVRRAALVVAVPVQRQALRQAPPPERRRAVPEPGRGAHDFAYASRNGTAMDRSHARQRRLYARLEREYECFE